MAIIVKGGGGKPEEEKAVTAGTSAIVVNPSSGKVMKKVTVNPTPSQSKTVTPSTSQQTVSPDSGKLLSKVIVKAMEDVTPEVTAQTPVITQIAENLGVTITTPSGTNKQILQGNNANLLNIKNNAKKEGAYVWKKYDKCPKITISFSGTIGSTKPVKVTVSSSQIDVSTLTESFFTGLSGKCSNKNGEFDFSFPSDGSITISPVTYSFAYNQSTHQIEIDGTPYIKSFDDVTKTQDATFIDFIVSDDSTAYPDGGTQGGYWYEKVVEGIDLSALGWTKCAIDYITPSTDTDLSVPLRHSLGIAPKYIHIKSSSNFTPTYYKSYLLEFVGCYSKDRSFHGGKMLCRDTNGSNEFSPIFSSDSEKIIIRDTYLMKGIQYQIITIG